MKVNKFIKYGLLTLLTASTCLSSVVAVASESQAQPFTGNAITGMSASLGEGVKVNYFVDLPQGYSSPELTIGENVISEYKQEGNKLTFVYNCDFASVDDDIVATLNAKNSQGVAQQIGTKTGSVEDYWHSVFTTTASELELSEKEHVALKTVSASALNYFASRQEHIEKITPTIALTSSESSLLYTVWDNPYSVEWEKRSLTFTEGETDATGFEWKDETTVDYSTGVALKFKFAVASGTFNSLKVKLFYGENAEIVTPVQLPQSEQTEAGKTLYTFATKPLKATEFSSQIGARVYDGTQRISKRAIYSVNRCLDKMHYATSGTEKTLVDATYFYGKACTWYSYFDSAQVTELPARWENGIYDMQIFDYRYDDARMLYTLPSYCFGDWTIWIDGKTYTTGTAFPVEEEGYTVIYDNSTNAFVVELDGATVGGIVVTNVNLKIVVNENSSLFGQYYRTWDDKNAKKSGCIAVHNGNIIIDGAKDKTLEVEGSLLTSGTLTVQGGVKVDCKLGAKAINGVEATAISVLNGAQLCTTYNGGTPTKATGVLATSGDVTINDGKLSSYGYETGIALCGYLQDDSVKPTFRVDGENSVVDVKCKGAGLTFVVTAWGVDMNSLSNREVNLNAGKITLDCAYGINYADVVLNSAELNIYAHDGNGIGQDRACKLTTISGDYKVGKINIVCTQYNEWWNVYGRAILTDGINIDGGEIKMSVANRKTVIGITKDGVQLNFDNCDVYLSTNNDLDRAAAGIYVENSGIVITVQTAARVFVENAAQVVSCWMPADTTTPATLYVYGDMAGVNCRGGIGQWGDTTIVAVGRVR